MTPDAAEPTPQQQVTRRIGSIPDWRGQTLAHIRALIHEALPDVHEALKWAKATTPGVPVWERDGGLCTGEVYQRTVKLTFHRGASLPDPAGLFNASLDGGTRRAIDLKEGETVDEHAFRALIRAAADANAAVKAARKK